MIIGITGSIGAGKGTVVEYLKTKGFTHVSARAIWTLELNKRNIPVNRDTMTELANELRSQHGPAYFVERALQEVKPGTDTVIESIRTIGEVELLKANKAILLGVDADQKLRYDRIYKRGSDLDQVSFEEFTQQEQNEASNDDLNKQNLNAVIEMADFVILNNGSLEELHQQVDKFLEQYATK